MVVTTGTVTTAIITGTTTTIIIIGTGQAVPDITAIGKAPARANEPEDLNLRLSLRHNRGNAYLACLGAVPSRFQTVVSRYPCALVLTFFLEETGLAKKQT